MSERPREQPEDGPGSLQPTWATKLQSRLVEVLQKHGATVKDVRASQPNSDIFSPILPTQTAPHSGASVVVTLMRDLKDSAATSGQKGADLKYPPLSSQIVRGAHVSLPKGQYNAKQPVPLDRMAKSAETTLGAGFDALPERARQEVSC